MTENAMPNAAEDVPENGTDSAAEDAEEKETDKNGLPVDNKVRSDLGRKISAYHRRMDDLDMKIGEMYNMIESLSSQRQASTVNDQYSDDVPMTKAELDAYLEEREKMRYQNQQNLQSKHDREYARHLNGLMADFDEDHYNKIMAELKTMTYDSTGNAKVDAELVIARAENAILKKQLKGKRENPIKGEKPESELGTLAGSKNKSPAEKMPAMDEHAEKYLDFIRQEDGEEAAIKFRKKMK